MKKRGKEKGIHIHLTNRLSYTLIAIFILVAVGVGVYAASSLLTPGVAPNPGHTISQTSPPSSCSAGQVLQWNGTSNADGGWTCTNTTSFSNINSYFVVSLGTKNWDQTTEGSSWFFVGPGYSDSVNFYVYKPISATFTAAGTPATATLGMVQIGSPVPPYYIVRQLSVNQVDFQQKNGGYNAANSAAVMLLPGQYTLTVSGASSRGAWLQLNSVYGQDNNKASTAWAQD